MIDLNRSFLLGMFLSSTAMMAQFPVLNTADINARPLHTLASGSRFMSHFIGTAGTLTIYEVDLSVHRTLQWPAAPAGMNWSAIGWITEDLFDTDPSTIEFVLQAYSNDPLENEVALGIYREDGTEIFFQAPGMLINGVTILYSSSPIFQHDGVTKMIVHSGFFSAPVTIYQLPGQLPCMDCTGSPQGSGLMTGQGNEMATGDGIRLFPNPTSSELNIMIPNSEITYTEVQLLDMAGKLVGSHPVTGTGIHVISIHHLPSGSYTCHLSGAGRKMLAGKFVISR